VALRPRFLPSSEHRSLSIADRAPPFFALDLDALSLRGPAGENQKAYPTARLKWLFCLRVSGYVVAR
jgi:hypothetical protein